MSRTHTQTHKQTKTQGVTHIYTCTHTRTHWGQDEYSVEEIHQILGHACCKCRPLAPKEIVAQWLTTKAAIKPYHVGYTAICTAEAVHRMPTGLTFAVNDVLLIPKVGVQL